MKDPMLFGHNTNVKVGDTDFHVQTEDRGVTNALIDTTVYFHGRVLHRRTNNYFDLLPLNAKNEPALKQRLDEQHRAVVEELRTGTLHLPLPQETRSGADANVPNAAPVPKVLTLVLINSKTWLAGKRATLDVSVQNRESGEPVNHARIVARVEGAADSKEFKAETGIDGRAQLAFDMPRISGAEPALVIEAMHGGAKGHLRFQLRAKPKVPAAS
ncbi:MAG: hypothetical protein WBB89_20895 [Candidatus Acidiferrum sp.]